jgi:beta-lactamase regulating signal transducer with metallopeptidase domain
MTAISLALSAALVHFIWEGAAIAFLLSIALIALRKRTANARYLACCAAMAALCALPIGTAWIVYQGPAALTGGVAFTVPIVLREVAVSPRSWLSATREWVLPVWAMGVVIFAVRLTLAWRHAARLRRAAAVAEGAILEILSRLMQQMNVTRPVRVLVSHVADAPSLVGWLKPVILIPAAALAGLNAAQLEAILAHEMAHIRRHDYLANMLQMVVETLLFYHPAVWWISSRMRQERELCCDDLAIRHCGDAIGYARALTRLERMRVTPEPMVAANGGSLLFRIQRLTGVVRECAPSKLPAVLAVLAAALCIPLTMHRAQGQDQLQARANITEVQTATAEVEQSGQPGRPSAQKQNVDYPFDVIARGVTGTVTVEATVGSAGAAADARVLSGPVELRRAALHTVLDWHFPNARSGETHLVSIEYGPDSKIAVAVDAVKVSNIERRQEAALTENRLLDELAVEKAKAQLDQAALQGSLDALKTDQLRTELAEQVRKLEAAAQAGRVAEEEMQLQAQIESMGRIYGPNSPNIKMLEARIAALLANFVVGRKVARIDSEIPAEISPSLQVGDTLTEESIRKLTEGVESLHSGLKVLFYPINATDVGVRIIKGQ